MTITKWQINIIIAKNGGDMSVKRKCYSASEKVAWEAIESELTMTEMVAKYGVRAIQINVRKRQATDHISNAFSDKCKQRFI